MGDGGNYNTSSEPDIPDMKEFSKQELLYMENEIAGMYLSGHPMDEYDKFAILMKADRTGEIISNESGLYFDGKKVSVVCIISRVKTQLTKNNKMMAFVNIEDRYGTMEVVIFPNVYEKYAFYLNDGNVLIVRGTLNFKENEEPKLICDSIEKARSNDECKDLKINIPSDNEKNTVTKKNQRPTALYLRIDDLNTDLYNKAKRVLDIFEGTTPVIFYLTNSNRKVKAPTNMWVSLNDVMIRELKQQLGESNVVAK